MKHRLDFRTANSLWASVLVETLFRAGVRDAVISPGSRSTPITLALANHGEIRAMPVLDERSAAFFALGIAKASGSPVVLLCTSGSAGANYFPAVIEAQESGVPLVVITADRPPELRACASGQTIDQQKLFGGYVQFYHELAVPELDLGRLRYLRQTTVHAVSRSRWPQPGPVHLNAPFRDPLAPIDDGGTAQRFGAEVEWGAFFADGPAETAVRKGTALPSFKPHTRGVIVVGPSQPVQPEAFAADVGLLASKLGWPVLADGLAPVRNFASQVPGIVTTYDAFLRHAPTAERLRPDVVVCVSGWPTSKVLRGWLEASDAPTWLISTRSDNRDALHGRTVHVCSDLQEVARAVSGPTTPGSYGELWMTCERAVRARLDADLRGTAELFEPKAAWLMAHHLPAGTPLFIANSMPVRDVEYVWPPTDRGIHPLCNRGANGIDGTLSTALGVALAKGKPAVLLTGDLAFLHDSNGLLLSRCGAALTVVVINNAGGGIFEHLPIARFDPPFEKYFATPQSVDLALLCAAHGVEHVRVATWDAFTALVSTLPVRGVRVLELATDRKDDSTRRKRLFNELATALTTTT